MEGPELPRAIHAISLFDCLPMHYASPYINTTYLRPAFAFTPLLSSVGWSVGLGSSPSRTPTMQLPLALHNLFKVLQQQQCLCLCLQQRAQRSNDKGNNLPKRNKNKSNKIENFNSFRYLIQHTRRK